VSLYQVWMVIRGVRFSSILL